MFVFILKMERVQVSAARVSQLQALQAGHAGKNDEHGQDHRERLHLDEGAFEGEAYEE